MSLTSSVFNGLGIGELPHIPTSTSWLSSLIQYPLYVIRLFIFFFKLLIIPSVPTELKFLSLLVFTPMSLVFGWIILKTVIAVIP
jgi:hypothetical protein